MTAGNGKMEPILKYCSYFSRSQNLYLLFIPSTYEFFDILFWYQMNKLKDSHFHYESSNWRHDWTTNWGKLQKIGVRETNCNVRPRAWIYTFILSPHVRITALWPSKLPTSHVQSHSRTNQSPRAIAAASRAAHSLTGLADRKSKPKRPSSAVVRALPSPPINPIPGPNQPNAMDYLYSNQSN